MWCGQSASITNGSLLQLELCAVFIVVGYKEMFCGGGSEVLYCRRGLWQRHVRGLQEVFVCDSFCLMFVGGGLGGGLTAVATMCVTRSRRTQLSPHPWAIPPLRRK